MNKARLISIFCIALFLFIPFYVSDSYAIEAGSLEGPDVEIIPEEPFEGELAELIIEVGSYEPTVITASVIEEQDVSVYANLVGIPTNPTASTPKISRIITTVKGNNPYVAGAPRYHKPRIFSLTDLGYLEIKLKRIPKEEDVPDNIDVNMTARIYYDVETKAIGGEDTRSNMQIVSEDEFFYNMLDYGFLGDRIFVRVKDIGTNGASFELYDSSEKRIGAFSLREGQISKDYSLVPGSDLMQDKVRLRLDSVKEISAQVELEIEKESIKLSEKEHIYDGDWRIDLINDDGVREGKEEGYIVLYKRGIDQAIVLKGGDDLSIGNDNEEIKENLRLIKKNIGNEDVKSFKESLEEFKDDISDKFKVKRIIPAFKKNARIKVGSSVSLFEEDKVLVENTRCPNKKCTLTQIKDDRIVVEVPNTKCDGYLTKSLKVDDEEDLHSYCDKSIELEEIRTGKEIAITLLTGTGKGMTTSDFILHLPIEKRFISFAPEEIDQKINETKKVIDDLEKLITDLDDVVRTWTAICLSVGAVITVGAFFTGIESKEAEKEGIGKVLEGTKCTSDKECTGIHQYCSFTFGKCAMCTPGFYNCDSSPGCESTSACGMQTFDNKDLFVKDGELRYVETEGEDKGQAKEYYPRIVSVNGKKYLYTKEGGLVEYEGLGKFAPGEDNFIYKGSDVDEYIIPLRKNPFSTGPYKGKYEGGVNLYNEGLFAVVNTKDRVAYVYSVGRNGKIDYNLNDESDDLFVEGFYNDEVYAAFENKYVRQVSKGFYDNKATVNVDGQSYKLNVKDFVSETVKCEQVMDEKVCAILFNACDPVMCPPSRCDFGGQYRVNNVVQSGLVGSLMLCLPNFVGFGGEVVVPFCLSGILAFLKVMKSYLEGYVQCLTTAKIEGKSVGICDKIRSIFVCETIWNEVMTLLNGRGGLIGLIVEKLFGTGGGGGEYLGGIGAGIEESKNVVNYFVNSYATTAFAAYRGRSTKEVGTEVCKMAIYGKGPAFGEFFEQITTPQDPTQFTAFFEEQPWSVRTRESRYEVYYHIYAGAQETRYSVFLRSENLPTEFVARNERLLAGGYADVNKDLIASSGYQEICVDINGKIQCGFGKIVSTDFGVSRMSDYLVSHDVSREINSEAECRSEPAGGLLPEVAVTRKCSVDNPGKGLGVEARWVEVGSCGDRGTCWLEVGDLSDASSRNDNPVLIRESFIRVCENQGGEICNVGQICSEDGKVIFSDVVKTSRGENVDIKCCSKGTCVNTKKTYDILSEIKISRNEIDKEKWDAFQLMNLDDAIDKDNFEDWFGDDWEIRDEAAGIANVRRHHPNEFFYFKGMNALMSDNCDVAKDILMCEDRDMRYKVYSGGKAVEFSCCEFADSKWHSKLLGSSMEHCSDFNRGEILGIAKENCEVEEGEEEWIKVEDSWELCKISDDKDEWYECSESCVDLRWFYDLEGYSVVSVGGPYSFEECEEEMEKRQPVLEEEEEEWKLCRIYDSSEEFTSYGCFESCDDPYDVPYYCIDGGCEISEESGPYSSKEECEKAIEELPEVVEEIEEGPKEKEIEIDEPKIEITDEEGKLDKAKTIFDEFVEYYKKCHSYTSGLPCSCGSFDYSELPKGYRIEFKNNEEQGKITSVTIWLLKESTNVFVALLSKPEEIKKTEVERSVLCTYFPLEKEPVKDLNSFKIEDTKFSRDKKVFLMKNSESRTCFSRIDRDNYDKFLNLNKCEIELEFLGSLSVIPEEVLRKFEEEAKRTGVKKEEEIIEPKIEEIGCLFAEISNLQKMVDAGKASRDNVLRRDYVKNEILPKELEKEGKDATEEIWTTNIKELVDGKAVLKEPYQTYWLEKAREYGCDDRVKVETGKEIPPETTKPKEITEPKKEVVKPKEEIVGWKLCGIYNPALYRIIDSECYNGPCSESGISQKYKLTYVDIELGSYSTKQVCEKVKKIQGISATALIYFDSFVKKYKCVSESDVACSCGSFEYNNLPNNYAIKIEQVDKEEFDIKISLLKRTWFLGRYKETGIYNIVETKFLCAYYPLNALEETRLSRKSLNPLDEFMIERNMHRGKGSTFAYNDQIYIMQYSKWTCFVAFQSPNWESYNVIKEMKSC